MGLPEPPFNRSNENLSANSNEMIIVTDSDTDDEGSHTGYELIPMGPDPDEEDHTDDDEEDYLSADGEQSQEPTSQVPPITRAESTISQELWANNPETRPDIVMDSAKVTEVLQAMNNFTLPSNAIPEWAHNVPEDLWKQRLLERLQNSPPKPSQ